MSWCHNCQRINRYCILHQGQHPRRRKRKRPHSLPCWPHTIGTYTHVPPFVLPRTTTTHELVILHNLNYGVKRSTTWTNFHYALWKVCVNDFLIVYNHLSFYTWKGKIHQLGSSFVWREPKCRLIPPCYNLLWRADELPTGQCPI